MLTRVLLYGDGRGRAGARLLLGVLVGLFCYFGIQTRHSPTPLISPIQGALANTAVAALLMVVVLLNAKWVLRLWRHLGMSEPGRVSLFAVAFAAILGIAILCRIVWTRNVLFPGTTPDGSTYLLPALEHPKLPLDEERPVGFPYLISFSLAVFGHPVGILILHNLLSLLSAAVLALAVQRRLGLPLVALLLLSYMLFCSKNIAFEYLLLTEHLLRCLIALILGILLWAQRRVSFLLASVLSVLTVFAVLTKPNTIVLIPGVLAGLGTRQGLPPRQKRRALTVCGIYMAVMAVFLGGYMTLSFVRFGSFQITSMTGYALYWNVNLLTDLNGPGHPEVKRELRRFFPLYLAKYGRRNVNLGNWAVWGARTPETDRDFGSQSPAGVVRAYARRLGSGSLFHRMNRVFMDLALEGIRAHPWKYIGLSLRSTESLIRNGLTFSYSMRPIEETGGVASRAEFFRLLSVVAKARSEHLVLPRGFRPGNPRSPAVLLPEALGRVLAICFFPFAVGSIALLILCALEIGLDRSNRESLLLLVPSALTIGLYLLLCGFVLSGEDPRFLVPVQDLIVLLTLAAFAIAWRSMALLIDATEPGAR